MRNFDFKRYTPRLKKLLRASLRELCVLFLFLNSAVNPFLTTFRINELKKSVRIVLRLRRQDEETNTDFQLPTGSLENNAISM